MIGERIDIERPTIRGKARKEYNYPTLDSSYRGFVRQLANNNVLGAVGSWTTVVWRIEYDR